MSAICERFRGFLPVAVDVETGGFDAERHALLEMAVCIIEMDDDGRLHPGEVQQCNIEPFPGGELDPKSLEFTGIDPGHPLRDAKSEIEALRLLFRPVRRALRQENCQRAVMVAHNPAFDLAFVNAAIRRTGYKRNPFHPFSAFDTATLAGLAFGQTVLARAVTAAGLDWDSRAAHTALYDVERTAQLFCTIVNRWDNLVRHVEREQIIGERRT